MILKKAGVNMTVKQYIDSMSKAKRTELAGQPSLMETMLEQTDIWSNNACRGYLVSACIGMGMERKQIDQLMDSLTAAFDNLSIEDAEAQYMKSEY